MECPKCNLKLIEGTYEGIPTYLCDKCDGILFKQKHLITVIKRMSLDLFSSIGINTVFPEIPDKHLKTNCPECHGVMEQYGYMGSKKVTIDKCISCNWLWLDAQELSAIAKMYVLTEKNKEHYKSLYKNTGSNIVSTHVSTNSLSQMFLLGFVVSKGLNIASKLLK